jgi:drug/metabolite transporter (DMT)-like permease
MVNHNEKSGVIEMVIAMVISGSIGVFVLKSGQASFNVVFLRCAVASVSLFALCLARGMIRREYFRLTKLVPIALAGLLLVANWVLFFTAFRLTTISLATIVYHVNPFIMLFAGALLLGQSVTVSDALWTLLAFVGLVAVANAGGTAFHLSGDLVTGLALVLAATTLYSASVLITKKVSGVPAPFIVMIQTAVGTVALAPLASPAHMEATWQQWLYLVALGLVHTAALYWLMYAALQKLSVSAIAVLTFVYPLAAVFFDYVVFGNAITWLQAVGALLILTGTLGVKLHWGPRPILKSA